MIKVGDKVIIKPKYNAPGLAKLDILIIHKIESKLYPRSHISMSCKGETYLGGVEDIIRVDHA